MEDSPITFGCLADKMVLNCIVITMPKIMNATKIMHFDLSDIRSPLSKQAAAKIISTAAKL
jgi:hypothetical protein